MDTETRKPAAAGFRNSRSHATDLFFTLSLFCVFAAAAFIVIMIGIRVYQSTVEQMQDTYSTRTAISYVAEKIRRHDASGQVAVSDFEGGDALVLSDDINGVTYLTYIYAQDDYLCELTVRADAQATRAQGEQVIAVEGFSIEELDGGFLEVSAADSGGDTICYLLHLRSEN